VLNADGLSGIIFQQNDARPHASGKTQQWLADSAKKHGFSLMHLPPNSPDIKPILNLWAQLKLELHRRYPDAATLPGSPDINKY